MSKPSALGVHVFAGNLTCGIQDSFDVGAQIEVFDLGKETVPYNMDVPFIQAPFEEWRDLQLDGQVDFIFGNPRCTGFSALGYGCSEDAHGAWSKPTIDIRQLAEFASWVKPPVWTFESVQNAGSVGRELIEWVNEKHGKPGGYRLAEIYHNASMFGSCQSRARVFFVWYKKELKLPVVEMTEQLLHRGPHVTVRDCIGDLAGKPWTEVWKGLKDRVATLGDVWAWSPIGGPIQHYWFKPEHDSHGLLVSIECLKPNSSLNHVPVEVLDKYSPKHAAKKRLGISFSFHAPRRLHWDKASPVIYSSSYNYIHPEHKRALTVREMTRIMGLPDTWVVLGKKPAEQLGKAVSVQVGRWIGKMVASALNGSAKRELDTEHQWERFDLDSPEFNWVPKRPRIARPSYDENEEEL